MTENRIQGRTFRWQFVDGPMAGRTFEHTFGEDGAVTYRPLDGSGKATRERGYEVASVSDDIEAVSYLSSGYTLTTVLDFSTGKLVAFASNDEGVTLQHGTFEHQVAP